MHRSAIPNPTPKIYASPTNAAVSPNTGDIYITDGYGNSRVHRYTSEGKHIVSWGAPGIALLAGGPSPASYTPGRLTAPESVTNAEPGSSSVPSSRNHSGP